MTDEVRPGKVTFDPNVFGSTGLRQFGGFVAEEFLPELSGARGMRVYREMADNDATVGAMLFAVKNLIKQVDWTMQAADDTPDAEAAKQFFEEALFEDMSVPFSVVIDEVCSMFVYGFAPMEIMWKRRGGPESTDPTSRSKFSDGKIGLRNIALRSQPTISRWMIDEDDGSIDGLWQQPYAGPVVAIPIEKLLLFRTTEERGNPEGKSILRTAYRSWHHKSRIENIEGVGVERDLAGLPVGLIPMEYMALNATPEQKIVLADWMKMVTGIRRDQREGVIIPSDVDPRTMKPLFDLKLLSTGGSRAFDTTKIVDRYARNIATSVLADFIFLGQSAVGSFALSSDKTALFATAVSAFLKSIADVFNRHLFPRLALLNAIPQELVPALKPGDIEQANLGELGQLLGTLAGAGMPLFPDRELENHLRGLAGLPLAPEDGEEIAGVDPLAPQQGDQAEDDPVEETE